MKGWSAYIRTMQVTGTREMVSSLSSWCEWHRSELIGNTCGGCWSTLLNYRCYGNLNVIFISSNMIFYMPLTLWLCSTYRFKFIFRGFETEGAGFINKCMNQVHGRQLLEPNGRPPSARAGLYIEYHIRIMIWFHLMPSIGTISLNVQRKRRFNYRGNENSSPNAAILCRQKQQVRAAVNWAIKTLVSPVSVNRYLRL